jgi:hypothetical protein
MAELGVKSNGRKDSFRTVALAVQCGMQKAAHALMETAHRERDVSYAVRIYFRQSRIANVIMFGPAATAMNCLPSNM